MTGHPFSASSNAAKGSVQCGSPDPSSDGLVMESAKLENRGDLLLESGVRPVIIPRLRAITEPTLAPTQFTLRHVQSVRP